MKYYDAAFTLTKNYAAKLRQRVSNFRETSGTRKNLYLTFVSCYGLVKNIEASSCIQNEVVLNDLF